MKPKEIQKLIDIVEKSNISELEVSRWGKKVLIRKYLGNHFPLNKMPENIILAQSPTTASVPTQAPTPMTSIAAPIEAKEKSDEIRSPMVGTYYRAPAPDAEPYVKVGDTVSQGQVLCIIEAMKLMNEIEAEFPCRIVEILIDNAQPVEYNQTLFKVEKI